MLILKAGASIVPELSERTELVLGIKEPPVSEVQNLLDKDQGSGRKRTWMMFSHTHKGQVSLLDRLKPCCWPELMGRCTIPLSCLLSSTKPMAKP